LRVLASSILRFRDHKQWHNTVSRTSLPVAETSTWQTHNTHNRQTSMPPAGFEPAIPAGDRLQTLGLDRSAKFMIVSRLIIDMRHVWYKSYRENRNMHFVLNKFFPKIVSFIR
jgi:hypothetical protein